MPDIKNSQLMMLATVCTFLLLGMLMFFPIPDKNAQIFMAVSGIALGFYFGSSVNKNRPPEDQRKGDTPNEKAPDTSPPPAP